MKNEHEASVWYPAHSKCKLGPAQDVSQEFFFPPQSLQKTLQEYFYVIQEKMESSNTMLWVAMPQTD